MLKGLLGERYIKRKYILLKNPFNINDKMTKTYTQS